MNTPKKKYDRRCIDLRDLGKIRRHPEKKTIINARGNKCQTWVVGVDPNAGRSKLQEAYKRIKELRERIRELVEEIRVLKNE